MGSRAAFGAKRPFRRHAGLVPAIHVFGSTIHPEDLDARDIGEQSGAVLRTVMRGHDDTLLLQQRISLLGQPFKLFVLLRDAVRVAIFVLSA